MKKIAFSVLSILLAGSLLHVKAEENNGKTQDSNSPTVQTASPSTGENGVAHDGSTLYTDQQTISDVNKELANTETFEVANNVEVDKSDEGVTVGVTDTGDLEVQVTNPETLKEIDKQEKMELDEETLTEDNNSEEVTSAPEEGTLLEYSLHIPQEQIDTFIGTEESLNSDSNESTPPTNVDSTENSEEETMEAQWGNGLYLKKKGSYYANGGIIRASTYQGPAEGKMKISDSVAYTFSATGGMSVKTIAYELGYSYAKTKTVEDEYGVKVPRGKTYRVTAKEYNKMYKYEIWNDPYIGGDYKEASGTAKRPIGVSFTKRSI